MRTEQKREAIRAYKERKRSMGAYAVKCAATGQAWVGQTRNLDTAENPLWFSLRLGSHRSASLQQAWNAHGRDALSFEVLEQLDEADIAFPETKLKAMCKAWGERLDALHLP
jgi:hypothetical protein